MVNLKFSPFWFACISPFYSYRKKCVMLTIRQRIININPPVFIDFIIPIRINRFCIRIPRVKGGLNSVSTAILIKKDAFLGLM